jgi:predicted transcriptional regulator of viral defense system
MCRISKVDRKENSTFGSGAIPAELSSTLWVRLWVPCVDSSNENELQHLSAALGGDCLRLSPPASYARRTSNHITSVRILPLGEKWQTQSLDNSNILSDGIHIYRELAHMTEAPASRLPRGRAQLVQVLAASGDVIHVSDVTKALAVSRIDAAKRLARWREQGWLSRVGRGAYVPASIDTLGSELVLDDAWVLVPALFAPAYIGGRTAAEHWDLTEQIFKDVVVITAQAIREKRQKRQGFQFLLKHIDASKIFGTRPIWRHNTKVPISDVHRTIVDMLDDPSLGGGIQHVWDCLNSYFRRADRDDQKLVEYGDRLGNGAVFKRLGFLAEKNPSGAKLAELCSARLTAGNAKLDTGLNCPRLVSKWRLLIPQTWM